MENFRHTESPDSIPYGLAEDEAVRAAREQYREHGLPRIEPDNIVAPHLVPDEWVVGQRAEASVARVDDVTQMTLPEQGPLYVTNVRLLHMGRRLTSVALADVGEITIADDRILLTIGGALGLMLDVGRSRELHVLLAAAKAAAGR